MQIYYECGSGIVANIPIRILFGHTYSRNIEFNKTDHVYTHDSVYSHSHDYLHVVKISLVLMDTVNKNPEDHPSYWRNSLGIFAFSDLWSQTHLSVCGYGCANELAFQKDSRFL